MRKASKLRVNTLLTISEAIEAFTLFDKDNDQGLDIDEVATVFRAVGQRPNGFVLTDIMDRFDVNSTLMYT